MNQNKIKYPWMLIKFKENAMEIQGGNLARLNEGKLGQLLPLMQRELRLAKVNARKE